MFRLAKLLYLLAVVGLLVVLALVDQFAPALHANALRQRLRGELVSLHSLFLQQQELDRLRQAAWTGLVAHELETAPTLRATPTPEGEQANETDSHPGVADSSSEAAATAEPDGESTPEQAAPVSLDESLATAIERALALSPRDPPFTLVLSPRGRPLAAMGAPEPWPSPLPTSVPMLCEGESARTALIDAGDRVLIAACAPIMTEASEHIGSVVTAQPIDIRRFEVAHPDLDVQVTLFRHDGAVLATSIDDPARLAAARQLLDGLRAHDDLPTVESPVPRVAFDQDGPVLHALLAGSVPLDQAGLSPLGFAILLDAGGIPPDLATLVFDNLASLRGSDRLVLTVGLGLVLLLFGLVLFEFEGFRYRRAVGLLEYQLARQPSANEREPTGAPAVVTGESAPVLVTTAAASEGPNASSETDLHALYMAYVDDFERQGEGAKPSSYTAFRERLAKVEADLKRRHGCRSVRFSTARVEGSVVVLATPVS